MSMLISDEYRQMQKQLHENPKYGVASLSFAPMVKNIIESNDIQTLTDYGAGKMRLAQALEKDKLQKKITYQPYDPAFEEYGPQRKADLVCCIDVLEHIEPENLDNVLRDISSLMLKAAFITIHTGPAGKVLSDGRNAHLIQKPTSWWLPILCHYFEIGCLQKHHIMGPGFWFIAEPLKSNA